MEIYVFIILIISLSALFAYLNQRFLKMPFVIGLFFLSTVMSLLILSSKLWAYNYYLDIKELIDNTNTGKIITDIMLGFLLFAGALHTDWADLRIQLKKITIFALMGVILSTLIIGFLFYGLCYLVNIPIDLIYCMIFGALISPTDPIAVLGILKKANVPQPIETTIVGESLFNDGIGVVIFIALVKMLEPSQHTNGFLLFLELFAVESIGGIIFGLTVGYLLHKLLKSIDHYETEVLLTLAFVMTGYFVCLQLHISGALAMVVMGLMTGNYKTEAAMSDLTQEYLHKFWELLDVILNAILFILIGFLLIDIEFKPSYIFIALIAIFIVLLSRAIVVTIPKLLFPKIVNFTNKENKLIIWGGLRGGLSLALVISLAENEQQNLLTICTYFCVVFSILIQGLTIEKLAKRIK